MENQALTPNFEDPQLWQKQYEWTAKKPQMWLLTGENLKRAAEIILNQYQKSEELVKKGHNI